MNPWLLAIRPKTLPASISPIILANAMNWGPDFNWTIAILTLITALFLQIAVNFANDYFDFRSGVDTDSRLGPQRATQSGLIAPSSMISAIIFSLIIALASGGYLIFLGGMPIFILFIACVIGVIWYSGGPWPLASLGLGELTVFLFFGWAAILGTQYLHQQQLSLLGWWLGTQVGLISAAIMLVNNIRDIHTDKSAKKMTLAVRLGLAKGLSLYSVLIVTPFIMQTTYFLFSDKSFGTVIPFLTTPLMIRLLKKMPNCSGEDYNVQLADTAKFLLFFSLALSVGQLI